MAIIQSRFIYPECSLAYNTVWVPGQQNYSILSRKYKPRIYLIEGATGGIYSATSLSNIVKQHQDSVGKKLWPHLLRHSIATHMINGGVNILQIQRFLGHNSIRTTERYYQYLRSKGVVQISRAVLINKAA